jgi:2-oxoglutarate dehydrogenase E2 component (dihydrolipoamide succinyltransferase)
MSMTDILVPFEQEGTQAIVRSWLKKVGDRVELNDPLVELETDKVTQEVPAPASGILEEILLDSDAEALPGGILGRMRLTILDDVQPAIAPQRHLTKTFPTTASNGALSPSVRRGLQVHGLNPEMIEGTGKGGRITREDVERVAASRSSIESDSVQHAVPTPETAELEKQPQMPKNGAASIPHDRMRLAIAANMLNSVTIAPHVTAVFEADFSAIIAHRRSHKAAFEKEGANLTFTAYLMAACVQAMRVAPAINSRWYDDRLDIFDDINIGIGTALGDKGLVVPVMKRVQDMSLQGIASKLSEFTTRARTNKLSPSDMRDGTFTISNHGVSGSLFASPIIISQPQSAILGVGKLEKRVVVREVDGIDTIQIRPMAYVSLTIDHRVVDGHQTNLWLSKFVEVIEKWGMT